MDTQRISVHFHEVYFGGNWTDVHLKNQLEDVTWKEATTRIGDLHTIVALTYHIHYFVKAVTPVLKGKLLDAHDSLSFDHPSIKSQDDWEAYKKSIWEEAHTFVSLVASLPDSKLNQVFEQQKYGDYYRNLNGLIEHTHYHLGQITLLKKLIRNPSLSYILPS